MEQGPPIPERKKPAEAEPTPQRPRWNLFEMFAKRPETTAEKIEKAKSSEAEPGKPETTKRRGESLLKILSGETEPKPKTDEADAETPKTGEKASEKPTETPEQSLPIVEQIAEGARNLGGNVLRLIGGAREAIFGAEASIPEAERTDTRPLDSAETKVESALDDLEEAVDTSRSSGGGGGRASETGGDFNIPEWQLRSQQEASAAAAWLAAEKQIAKAEREKAEAHSALKMIGAVALGAVLLSGGSTVYNWYKLRQMRKEQKKAEKRDIMQQKELEESNRRIQELELQKPAAMDRAARQEYVREVSEYAVNQAEEIKEATKEVKEHLKERPVAPERFGFERSPVRNPEKLEVKQTLIERAGETLLGTASKTRDALSGGAAGIGGVFDFLTGKIIKPLADKIAKKPALPHRVVADPVQSWLNGTLLILGIVLVIAVYLAIF